MIQYKTGDLFKLIPKDRPVVIPHIVNDIGAWGSGFVVPLGKHFPRAKEVYLKYKEISCILGDTNCISAIPNVVVANMCAQTGIMSHSTGDRAKVNSKPIRYEALVSCMVDVREWIEETDRLSTYEMKGRYIPEIHCPKFGSDRAGGNWNFIEELIEEIWCDFDVTVYTL